MSGTGRSIPWLFQPTLADVSDICNDLAKKHGDWYPFAKEHAYVKGQWLGIPYLYISFPGSHRIDLFEKVGEKPPAFGRRLASGPF